MRLTASHSVTLAFGAVGSMTAIAAAFMPTRSACEAADDLTGEVLFALPHWLALIAGMAEVLSMAAPTTALIARSR